jgi:hypothetical protein
MEKKTYAAAMILTRDTLIVKGTFASREIPHAARKASVLIKASALIQDATHSTLTGKK